MLIALFYRCNKFGLGRAGSRCGSLIIDGVRNWCAISPRLCWGLARGHGIAVFLNPRQSRGLMDFLRSAVGVGAGSV
jgi:hypothetical protein